MEHIETNLPPDFVSQIEALFGEEANDLLMAIEQDPLVSIRFNPSKIKKFPDLQKVQWSDNGFYLRKRPVFTFDPLFHAGCYYPQEASSMFIEQVFRQLIAERSVRVLDLCAAPGGKSTHILSLLSEDSLLVSNEVIRSRANILSENISKWGYPNNIVTNNDPKEIGKLNGFFDVILIDAPCSGEGMFRKDRAAVSEWSLSNVQLCKERQQRIVSDVWSALKPDGLLIYSTCTYNLEENEKNVQWICDTFDVETVKLNIPDSWNITNALQGDNHCYRFLPHKTKGEGFFLSVLRKKYSELSPFDRARKEKVKNRNKDNILSFNKNLIVQSEEYNYIQKNNALYALHKDLSADYSSLERALNIVSFGVRLGEMKGKDFIPDQSLALSSILNREAFPIYSIDWKTAISYLRKEALSLDNSLPKGYILLMYKNIPLGFVKNIGNRANNLYPQEWRIRTSNIPESYESVLLSELSDLNSAE
ncbi:MAG: methyltransferase RsmF C-terminal domain-like protein [Dysgonomonas sp.]